MTAVANKLDRPLLADLRRLPESAFGISGRLCPETGGEAVVVRGCID